MIGQSDEGLYLVKYTYVTRLYKLLFVTKCFFLFYDNSIYIYICIFLFALFCTHFVLDFSLGKQSIYTRETQCFMCLQLQGNYDGALKENDEKHSTCPPHNTAQRAA